MEKYPSILTSIVHDTIDIIFTSLNFTHIISSSTNGKKIFSKRERKIMPIYALNNVFKIITFYALKNKWNLKYIID